MYLEMERMFPCTAAAEEGIRYEVTVGINEEQSRGHVNTVTAGHPESHARIEAIWRRMEEEGLVERLQIVRKFLPIDESELRATHSDEQIEGVASTARKSQAEINEWASRLDSVFATSQSYAAASSAVACSRQLAEWIVAGKIPSAFSLVRPPGHHADGESPCGFCLFNNAAQAVDAARIEGAERILVVDLDVHHGQGTQRIFYEDDDVLYFSIHRHEYGGFWPNLAESGSAAIGEGAGRGYNVNVPLQETGCGDADYLFILFSLLLPIARDFRPDLIVVSAGFDSLRGDPLGKMDLTPTCCAHLLHHLKGVVEGGKMLIVLEGGYNHSMVAEGAVQCLRVLLGEQPEKMGEIGRVKESTRESTLNTISFLLPHWPSLQQYASEHFKKSFPTPSATLFCPPERDVPTANIEQSELMRPERKDGVIRRPFLTRVLHGGTRHEGHEHPEGNSYERTERIQVCLDRLSSLSVEIEEVTQWWERGIIAWIERTHSKEHVERVRRTETMSDAELAVLSREWGDSFVTRGTWRAAVAAVATTLMAVETVFALCTSYASPYTSSFALVRPPGHHAKRDTTNGFCFFNNVAIAAKFLLLSHLPPTGRVLIVDWDVHLGDGTIDCLSSLPSSQCLFLSIHRSDEGTFFPPCNEKNGGGGRNHETNDDGHVLLPFSGALMGDDEYLAAIDRIVLPVAYSFAPDAILVSAGFDCLKDDPLGGYSVSPFSLSSMVSHLMAVAPVVAVMEGGYNLDSLASGVEEVVKRMGGEEGGGGREKIRRICPDAIHSLQKTADRCKEKFDLIQE
ncbi:hypothetical protein PFISCL1PPCAC_16102 [Pristionchus fissidentatus]|uniref:Histone deacetylase domain-containing protein n=1 Tax=Pristionchus fissidentatus TaxID=1538716 RepID=A0AAV5W266_9BILA|nr:hypothetical protein PFISCL1PPCAC_16102 [Pristionchus fissidentatus]